MLLECNVSADVFPCAISDRLVITDTFISDASVGAVLVSNARKENS